ncbi:4Fe-4S binding protein [uncultured Shewanella sp.]|uniref:4Fe-4S binding protein n=1 Tax=uncultured Shewanella sp. TaxID=173975 RepID=UPI002623DCFE|nr:4Fe-4S binding protein [uncultured Shewanella sp.]
MMTSIPIKIIEPAPRKIDKLVNFISRHKKKLYLIHGIMMIFFLILLIVPIFTPPALYGDTVLTNFRRFSIFLFWGLWFPLVLFSCIPLGRFWCGGLCPMGAASEFARRFGPNKPVPKWIKWSGTPIVSFAIITIWGQTLDVRDQPLGQLILFSCILVVALTIGFLYGMKKDKRPWCRHLCPIGLMLGVNSRLGAISFDPKKPLAGGDVYKDSGICPTNISLRHKTESRHCLGCFRCTGERSVMQVNLRKPGTELEQIHKSNPSLSEVMFIFISAGLALGGFLWLVLPQYNAAEHALLTWLFEHGQYWVGQPGPAFLMSVNPQEGQVYSWLDFFSIVSFMLLCAIAVTLTLSITTSLSAWCTTKLGSNTPFSQLFIHYGYQLAPVAMISIIIGLGATLFNTLTNFGFSPLSIEIIKSVLLILAWLWGIKIGYQQIKHQGLSNAALWLAITPNIIGALLLTLAWWPAIFGVDFVLKEVMRNNAIIIGG